MLAKIRESIGSGESLSPDALAAQMDEEYEEEPILFDEEASIEALTTESRAWNA